MRKSRYSEEQIAMALRQVEAGTPFAEVCRKMQVAESTFFRWKKVYGGLGIVELRRLKQLVADRSLDKTILQEALQRKWWRTMRTGASPHARHCCRSHCRAIRQHRLRRHTHRSDGNQSGRVAVLGRSEDGASPDPPFA